MDPFHRNFVIAAYVRVAGPDGFSLANPELVGHGLPAFTDAERRALIAQIGT